MFVSYDYWAQYIVVALVIYLCFWIIILCLYLTDLAVFLSGFAAIVVAFVQQNGFNSALFLVGGGIALIGAAILLFFGFTQVAKGMLFSTNGFEYLRPAWVAMTPAERMAEVKKMYPYPYQQ